MVARLALTYLLLCAPLAAQTTIYVDCTNPNCPGSGSQADPFCQIQDAINAAVDGDTVLVEPCTYIENIDFQGKAILVMSRLGPSSTIIDGNAGESVVLFRNDEGPDSILDGFTIQNGWGTACSTRYPGVRCGGGLFCGSGTSPTITNNIITSNLAYTGGGIYCEDSSPVLTNNTITGNRSSGYCVRWEFYGYYFYCIDWASMTGYGGGVASTRNARPTIEDNVISSNVAYIGGGGAFAGGYAQIRGNHVIDNTSGGGGALGWGAGVHVEHAVVEANVIEQNLATGGGGGIWCGEASIIVNNSITANRATHTSGKGGALYCVGALVVDNYVSANSATYRGGAIRAIRSQIIGNTIRGNEATGSSHGRGGGINASACDIIGNEILYNESSDFGGGIESSGSNIIGNVIRNNRAGNDGGGIHLSFSSASPLSNNTITNNEAGRRGGGVFAGAQYEQASILNSILWRNAPSQIEVWKQPPLVEYCDVEGGYAGFGNIDADPLFIAPENGDFRLACNSPCVEAGTNDPGVTLPPFDHSGQDLRTIGITDMGADEAGTFWNFNGPAIVGGPPVNFTATASPGHPSPSLSIVLISLGDGTSSGGISVPLAGGRKLMLDPDPTLDAWLSRSSVLREVSPLNGCAGSSTALAFIPATAPVGVTVHYAGVAWDLSTPIVSSISETKSFVTQ